MWDYRNKIADGLKYSAELIRRSQSELKNQSQFLDLAPTDAADKDGVYSNALSAAMHNPRVYNIALTGPYGSGKSSIIKSFLKNYSGASLHISLAAFMPETVSTSEDIEPNRIETERERVKSTPASRQATKQEIERSILQQMLYGADANKLPFSRFKRIQAPRKWASILASLYITLALFSCWHMYQKRDAIINGDYFDPLALSNWFNLTSFVLGVTLLWLAVHRFYVASFGVSLKSLSLKDIQITPTAIDQESILNRHLDEIIYFFQSTKYDLVIIEDLDRFNDPEIFVTLREINKIINENSGVKRTIRFLYALRDDMFVNTDRTKFFEFIIPVIPIINSSNSIDMVIEEGKRISIDDRLDPQFLREVSRYLSDLRLIKNIFNEYAIYVANLETDGENVLNANKLLAVLIYKNIFPNDFEKLHRNDGKLAKILGRHEVYIANGEARHKAEITRLEMQMQLAEMQLPANLQELRNIYAMALIEKLPDQTLQISIDGSNFIFIRALSKSEQFDQFVEAPQIFGIVHGGRQQLNITGFQAEVSSTQSYLERREAIERKSDDFKKSVLKTIGEHRSKISSIRATKLNELMRQNADDVEELFNAFKDSAELARFLVFEGHLDETYYDYTSLFHKGRLSPSDNKFLKQIRGYTNPAPDFQIDNPQEVIAEMRGEDFGQKYVLNVKIVDSLVDDPSTYAAQLQKLHEFIASDFPQCEKFLSEYYARGTRVSDLLSGLANSWEGFIPAAVVSSRNHEHVARLIAHLPESDLAVLSTKYSSLSEFVSVNLPQIMSIGIDFEPARLKDLHIEAADLSSLENYPSVARLLFDEGLYRISFDNLDFIFSVMLGVGDRHILKEQNYTSIINVSNAALSAKIDGDFEAYLQNVLLVLPENSAETVEAIVAVIKRDYLEFDDLRTFLERQSALIPTLDQVPGRLHALMFELEKIEPSWENCLAFLSSETYDSEVLTAYLNKNDVAAELSRLAVPDGQRANPLHNFLIENDALNDELYAPYMRALPKPFPKFPENLSWEKVWILIEEKKVSFSSENLAFLSEYDDTQIPFVAKNIDRYFELESECVLDDDFREGLLSSMISDEQKLKIIKAMDLNLLASMPSRAAQVGPIMQRVGADFSELDLESSRAIILHSKPIQVQISLFNNLHKKFDDQQIREILTLLPAPFSDIKPGWDVPRVDNTDVNTEFVEWLKARRIISSWSRGYFADDIRINNFRK
ncbi:MAG: P-loop NTPase fold protein [Casimicrobium sp.]